jgi:hypothetical protein
MSNTTIEVLQRKKAIYASEEFRAQNTQNCAAAYDVDTGEQLWKIEPVARPTFTKRGASRTYRVEQVAWSPDQQILLCMDSGESTIRLLGRIAANAPPSGTSEPVRLHDWMLPDEYRTNDRDPAAITWSRDGKLVVIQAYEGQRKRYTRLCADPATGKILQEIAGIGVIVDGNRFVACDLERKDVVTYSLETWEELSSFKMGEAPGRLTTVATSPDGRWLAGFHKRNLYIYDPQQQKQTAPLTTEQSP